MATYNLAADEISVQPTETYKDLEETDDKFQSEPKPRGKSTAFSLGVIAIILLVAMNFIALGFGITLTSNNRQLKSKSGTMSVYQVKTIHTGSRNFTFQVYPKSCKDAYEKGLRMSGLITLQPDFTTNPHKVFCDMKSVGGGWTLIASIHDDDTGGCSSKDKWSSYRLRSGRGGGYGSWLGTNDFGDMEAATSADYKTSAYYNVNATDMMIWHVPNNVLLSGIDQEAFLKYYTDNGFLSKYGNSLQALYSQHVPFVRAYPKDISAELMACMKSTNWTYRDGRNSWNGPSVSHKSPEILTFADKVYIEVNGDGFLRVNDSSPRKVFDQVDFTMETKTLPFTALAFIDNSDGSIENFTMKVKRNDTYRTYRPLSSEYAAGFTFRYHKFCGGDVCHIIFFVRGTDWKSSVSTPDYDFDGLTTSKYLLNFAGPFKQILVGYAVIRRLYKTIYSNAVGAVLRNVMGCFDKESKIDLSHFPSISTPVKFLKGNMSEFNDGVIPGYIEFRQYDHLGFPYALCPGVRVTNYTKTKLYCVGSRDAPGHCGDFAAWHKLPEHLIKRPSSSNYTVVNDITSSLLLFVR